MPTTTTTGPVRRELRLVHDPASVRDARHRLQHDLDDLAVERRVVQDASMVVGELVANAVRHGRPDGAGQVTVRWRVTDGRLEVTVRDGGGSHEPVVRDPSLDATSGRGLMIVAALAREWWSDTSDGTSVTAVVDLACG